MRKLVFGIALAGIIAGSAATSTVLAGPFDNPTDSDCHGARVTSLVEGYGSIAAAAEALEMTVQELQQAIQDTCEQGGD